MQLERANTRVVAIDVQVFVEALVVPEPIPARPDKLPDHKRLPLSVLSLQQRAFQLNELCISNVSVSKCS
jgi:hypothetical protein